jgi:hypothetical protein
MARGVSSGRVLRYLARERQLAASLGWSFRLWVGARVVGSGLLLLVAAASGRVVLLIGILFISAFAFPWTMAEQAAECRAEGWRFEQSEIARILRDAKRDRECRR